MRIWSLTLGAALSAALVSPAHAITFEFEGVFDEVPAEPAFQNGTTFTGRVELDETAAPGNPVPTGTFYPGAVTGFELNTSRGFTATATAGGLTTIDQGTNLADELQFSLIDIPGGPPQPYTEFDIALFFVDPSGSALTTEALPTNIDLDAFAAAGLGIFGSDAFSSDFSILLGGGAFTRFAVVPEPSVFGLWISSLGLGGGLSLVSARRRSRRPRARHRSLPDCLRSRSGRGV